MTGALLANRYELGALLGSGGAATVHEAVDLKLRREVAVKLLGTMSPDDAAVRRFSREALAAGSLQHPNVVGVFDTGEDRGRLFLVTELLRGKTLRQVLERGPVPLELARSWAKQLAAGLNAAHDKGLVHRDLKPSNIFITSDGWVKILDFGLVKLSESVQPQSTDSDAQRIVGTIGYMAPEQIRGLPVDARADLFNFGLVLYEMLAGKRAFADGSDTDTSYSIVVRKPGPLPPAVPRELRALILRCLAKDREKRPASAREVLRLLSSEAATRRSRLRLWAFPAAALLALVCAVGALALRGPAIAGPLAGSIAIFPFDTRAMPQPDALAGGMADLLTLDVEGSELRTLEWATIHRAAMKDETAFRTLERARSTSLKLTAKYFVLGSVRERKGELVIQAVLYETQSGRSTEVSARGKRSEIWRLTREISDQLQRRRRSPEELEASVAAFRERTTSSLPALTAFLEAKRLLDSSWDLPAAMAAARKAVSLDPDFTLALYLVARMPIGDDDQDAAEDSLRGALRHPERLSLHERVRAQSYLLRLQGKLGEAIQLLRNATREHPDEPLLWRHLAALLYHRGPSLGISPQESADAYQRQFELDPLDLEPIGILGELAILRGERAVALKLAERRLSLSEKDLDGQIRYQLARAWAAGDAADYQALLTRLKARATDGSAYEVITSIVQLELQMDGSADASDLAALLPRGEKLDAVLRLQPGFTPVAHTALVRGQIRDARSAMAEAAATHPGQDIAFYSPWIDTLELVHASRGELAASRAAAASLDVSADPTRAPGKQYLIGLLALRAHDFAAAEVAVRALSSLPELPRSSIVADLVLSLRARILAARGDPKAALALLDQEQLHIPERYFYFYNRARENFFRASLLVALGRPREALPLYEALHVNDLIDPVFYPAGQLYTARIYDSLGETDRAILAYERFTAMWKECDPEQRPEVLRAQARLQELRAHPLTNPSAR
jgi:tetratricopeptide (TPR) repeat protein